MAMTPVDQLTIMNDFLFSTVMQQEKYCKPLLESILKVKIRKLEYLNHQQDISIPVPEAKSVRLDVYVEDEIGTVYDLEVQTTNQTDFPKRIRYYQSLIDSRAIQKGARYQTLKPSFVIFICSFDAFERGQLVYTFRNRCDEEPDVFLKEEAYKIIINTKGEKGDISDDLKQILHYMDTGVATSDYTKSLEAEVESIKSDEKWRREYMLLTEAFAMRTDMGEHKRIVRQVRKQCHKWNVNQMADAFDISQAECEDVLAALNTHPDWDDEQIAEEVHWKY